MLMINWFSSACIVQAAHVGSLYLNTMISVMNTNKRTLDSGQILNKITFFVRQAVPCNVGCMTSQYPRSHQSDSGEIILINRLFWPHDFRSVYFYSKNKPLIIKLILVFELQIFQWFYFAIIVELSSTLWRRTVF